MITTELLEFQKKAVDALCDFTKSIRAKQTIIVKSPTGSGKTIMLIGYVDRIIDYMNDVAFVWLCPGKGNLEEQSHGKMCQYAPHLATQTLDDALLVGFEPGSTTFINWERITKKDNTAIADGDFQNLYDRIAAAKRTGTKFVVIIDEEHNNKTEKAQYIIDAFDASHIIRVSATPKKVDSAEYYEIDEREVIDSGLICRAIYLNDGIADNPDVDEGAEILIDAAEQKRRAIFKEYKARGTNVRPLVLIQFPNGEKANVDRVLQFLEDKYGYTHANGMVRVWLSNDDRKPDASETENNGQCLYILMKQAISTGWDCPRAKILVKLREGMSEQFTIQTIGRIRRMPERHHYENELLDCCYVYTFDQKYKEGLLGDIMTSYEKRTLNLKNKCKTFTLQKETKKDNHSHIAPREMHERIYNYMVTVFDLVEGDYKENQRRLENRNFIFGDHVNFAYGQGRFVTLGEVMAGDMKTRSAKVSTSTHGIYVFRYIDELCPILGLEETEIRAILERLFKGGDRYQQKITKLTREEFYAFVINNHEYLKGIARAVAAEIVEQMELDISLVVRQEFKIPEQESYKYDPNVRNDVEYLSNAYEKYTSGFVSKKVRWKTERLFEKYCEHREDIDWVYKNGDVGEQYMTLVYVTGSGRTRDFYPDYIVKKKDGSVWLIEAKGGEDEEGNSQNIDPNAPNKFKALAEYAKRKKVNWGFVRNYDDNELLFNNTEWHEELNDEHWEPIDSVF